MCGIAGILKMGTGQAIEAHHVDCMVASLGHRGPDEAGTYRTRRVALGSTRLSIIDLATGQQPLSNESGTVWVVFNGEIYNYRELTVDLKAKGHIFRTNSDTEVLVHLYEEYGPAGIERLNGQFAIALWDASSEILLIARDRVGVRPLFYTQQNGSFIFASELKAILSLPPIVPQLDLTALDQVFTFWFPLPPRTIFRNLWELAPGHYMLISPERTTLHCYWHPEFPLAGEERTIGLEEAAEEFQVLLEDAIRLRLRADVPVASYLSGGIDSTTTSALIQNQIGESLRTFSLGFTDAEFDESAYQQVAVAHLGTQHTHLQCHPQDISEVMREVIWHTEVPLLRTAPAPMYLLAKLVHEQGLKVVITGEGADEILAGYSIFKEALVRRFWARVPDSSLRPLLLRKLYPYIPHLHRGDGRALRLFFGHNLTNTTDPVYSHLLRWQNTARCKQFFSPALRAELADYDAVEHLRSQVSDRLKGRSPLAQAQYLEMTTFMSSYLLSSQSDRVSMAHSVEGRFPYLDHRLIEFCATLPPNLKMRGLKEKYLLKHVARGHVPDLIDRRSKQPYRAPINSLFGQSEARRRLQEQLSPEALELSGLFSVKSVQRLLQKVTTDEALSETEGMALVGILTTQLVHNLFVQDTSNRLRAKPRPLHYTVEVIEDV